MESLPANGEADVFRVHVLACGQVQGVRRGFLLCLVFDRRIAGGWCLPGHRDDLDGVSLERFSGRYGEFLAQDGDLVSLVRHEELQAPGQGDCAGDLEEVPSIAGQFSGRRLHIGGGCPWRLGEEEHAVELGGHGDGHALHGIAQQGIGDGGLGEAEQLVVALDAGAFGHAVLVVGVDRLLVAALDVGEGVVVGAGEALQLGRGLLLLLLLLLEVVCREDVLAAVYPVSRGRAGVGVGDDAPGKRLGVVDGALVVVVHGHHGHGQLLVGPGDRLQRDWGRQVRHGDGVEALHGAVRAGRGRGRGRRGKRRMRAMAARCGWASGDRRRGREGRGAAGWQRAPSGEAPHGRARRGSTKQ